MNVKDNFIIENENKLIIIESSLKKKNKFNKFI